jgi:acetyltransferase
LGPASSASIAARALLAGEALVAEDVGERFVGAAAIVGEVALARAIRERGAAVVVVREPTATVLRALRERPPALLVVTGPELPAAVAAQRVLGPEAQVIVGDGELVLCAPDVRELTGLRAAFSGAKVRLGLCPAPPWLPEWLAAPELSGCRAAGFVAASSLHAGWVGWARAAGPRQVLVPLGVEPPRVDVPRHPSLAPAAAAHALERLTGPVFPAPGVLALLLEQAQGTGPEGHGKKTMAPTPGELARWRQAWRALPLSGADGGEAPHPGLPLASPTDAFLAQRALLRREAGERTLTATLELPTLEEEAVARAEEVLRSAGQVLSEHESKVVLKRFGIEVTRQAVASSASGAAQYAEQIGFPVVLKAVSPDLRRKQELGAVVLDLTTSAAVRRAYSTIVTAVEERAPTTHLDGVLVAEQIPEGLELHCGAVALASGETALFARVLGTPLGHEYTLCLSPLASSEALLFAHATLSRVPLRRKDDPDIRQLAGLFLRLDALVRHFGAAAAEGEGRIELVDLSPVRLVAEPRGYVTLDARIVQRAHLEGL